MPPELLHLWKTYTQTLTKRSVILEKGEFRQRTVTQSYPWSVCRNEFIFQSNVKSHRYWCFGSWDSLMAPLHCEMCVSLSRIFILCVWQFYPTVVSLRLFSQVYFDVCFIDSPLMYLIGVLCIHLLQGFLQVCHINESHRCVLLVCHNGVSQMCVSLICLKDVSH